MVPVCFPFEESAVLHLDHKSVHEFSPCVSWMSMAFKQFSELLSSDPCKEIRATDRDTNGQYSILVDVTDSGKCSSSSKNFGRTPLYIAVFAVATAVVIISIISL